jgi:hypothetical protein
MTTEEIKKMEEEKMECNCGCGKEAEKCSCGGIMIFLYEDDNGYGDKKFRCNKCNKVKWSEGSDY